ncbi:FAH family protein, partial [Pseudomonas syringae]
MRLGRFELWEGRGGVGLVDGDQVRGVQGVESVRVLALAAIEAGSALAHQVEQRGGGETHDYSQLLEELRILPPPDHPDPAHLLGSGTGLTHLGSASARDKMNQQSGDVAAMTGTMRILKRGVAGGKPAA